MSSVASAPRPASGKKRKLRLAERTGINAGRIGELADAPPARNVSEESAGTSEAPAQASEAPVRAASSAKPAAPSEAPAARAGRQWTVTVALPGSIVDNAQTHELRSQLVGQVARACAIFNVDEIVVFKTGGDAAPPPNAAYADRDQRRMQKRTPGAIFMARLLQYLECPQYLRKHIFPVHPDLRAVGLVAPLDAPHHLRIEEVCEYREAVVVPPGSAGSRDAAANTAAAVARSKGDGDGDGDGDGGNEEASGGATTSSSAYTGLRKEMKINLELPVGTRVTLKMPAANSSNARSATVVPPKEPREVLGRYWGFEVRVADGLAAVWSECPHADGYDLSIGTSEHGSTSLYGGGRASTSAGGDGSGGLALAPFRHALIVFGGVEGLEPAVAAEDELAEECEEDVASLFDHYLNLCPQQGSRTIRTEEALLVGLAALKPHLESAGDNS